MTHNANVDAREEDSSGLCPTYTSQREAPSYTQSPAKRDTIDRTQPWQTIEDIIQSQQVSDPKWTAETIERCSTKR